jgi:tetratricopeptide (TPR) repeat protein
MSGRARSPLAVVAVAAAALALIASPAPGAAARTARAARAAHVAQGRPAAPAPAAEPAPPADPVQQAWGEARRLADAARYDSSLAVIRAALARHGDNVELRWLEAGVVGEAGRHRESVALYGRLVADHPEIARDLRSDLATQRLWAGDPAGAVTDFELWLTANPDDREARKLRALALARADRLRESLAAYDALANETPDDKDIAVRRARVLSWMGRHDESSAAYRAVLATDPANADARLGIAMNDNWAGRHRRAARLLDSLVSLPGADPEALKALAFARYWDGDEAGARRALDGYLAVAPGDAEALDLARRLGRESAASLTTAYERADDSDGLRIGTTTMELRWPVSAENTLFLGWRRDNVRDAGGTSDPLQLTAGATHFWNPAWSAHGSYSYIDWGDSLGTPNGGELGVTWRPVDRTRFDAAVAREPVMSRMALGLGISVLTWVAAADLVANERLDFHVAARAGLYSDDNRANRVSAGARFRGYSDRRVDLRLTFGIEHLDTKFDPGHGYYAPGFYREWGPGVEAEWRPRPEWNLGLTSQVGWQHEWDLENQPFYSIAGRAEVTIEKLWTLSLEAGRGNSNLQSDTGYERKRWQVAITRGF